ncbi:MAG: hypothetical protein ACJ77M_02680 [Thermoleophilaceae bacterium]
MSAMPGGMEAIQLSAALLRNQAPELVLRLGSTVAARVLERHGARGLITIGNAVLAAELPEQVSAGQTLRLLVQDATGDRVTLKLVEQQQAQQAQQPSAVSVPLPNGSNARVHVDEDASEEGGGRGAEHSVAVTYNSPSLGSMQFRLSVDGRAVAVTVRTAPGAPFDMAQERATELREALARATGRAAQVTVLPREEPVDLYA